MIVTLYRKFGSPKLAIDYLKARELAKQEMINKGGWTELTDEEKFHVIKFFVEDPEFDSATNNANKVGFLTSIGYSIQDAQLYLPKAYAVHHEKEVVACKKRADSIDASNLVALYLGLDDARDFIETTKSLYDLFRDQGIKGVNYGSVGEGLLDFIESTPGTSFEFLGLAQQGYTTNGGLPISGLITGLKDILINGNYKS